MPHLTLEYTKNLSGFDARDALLRLNKALSSSGHFDEFDIKSRAIPLDCFVIGTSPENRAFVHAKLSLLSGRSTEIKSMLSQIILQEMRNTLAQQSGVHVQICAEIMDIERDTYAKDAF